MLTTIAVVFMIVSAVVQANHCSSAGGCSSEDEPKSAVSLLQQGLQMNVLKDGDEDLDVEGSKRSAEGIRDYQCSDINRAPYVPLGGVSQQRSKPPRRMQRRKKHVGEQVHEAISCSSRTRCMDHGFRVVRSRSSMCCSGGFTML